MIWVDRRLIRRIQENSAFIVTKNLSSKYTACPYDSERDSSFSWKKKTGTGQDTLLLYQAMTLSINQATSLKLIPWRKRTKIRSMILLVAKVYDSLISTLYKNFMKQVEK